MSGGAPLNIVNGLREFALSSPGSVAVIDGPRCSTYAQVDERSNRLASALLSAGLEPGDGVAVLMGNRLEYVETAAALAKAGLVLIPLSPRGAPGETSFILEHSAARGLVVDGESVLSLPDSLNQLHLVVGIDPPSPGTPYERLFEGGRAVDPRVHVGEQDPFCVAYTSGTTGRPKGVVLSHRARVLCFYASAAEWGLGLGRRSIAVAPMYHGAGFAFAFAPVMTGGTVRLLRRWDPEQFLAALVEDQAHAAFLVPTHALNLRALGEDVLRRTDLGSLRTLFFNAAALPMPLKEWVVDSLPRTGVHECYGSTEAAIVSNLRPDDSPRKPGSVGPPWYMTEVRLVDDAGNEVPPGVPGELFSRSPYLMSRYLHDPQATDACTTDDGFLSSGDIAIADEEKFLTIVDRKKDVVITGGINVYPREVEVALLRHPSVRDVAVVGAPDATWGEAVVAFVVLREESGVTATDLDAYMQREVARYKRPRQWHLVEELPRNTAGKVLKPQLRARLISD